MKKALLAFAIAGLLTPSGIAIAQQADTPSAEHGEANKGYNSQMNEGMADANKKKHHHHKRTTTTTTDTTTTTNTMSGTSGDMHDDQQGPK